MARACSEFANGKFSLEIMGLLRDLCSARSRHGPRPMSNLLRNPLQCMKILNLLAICEKAVNVVVGSL